jgi:hypothetical protein
MSWTIEGAGNTISITVSGKGTISIHGTARRTIVKPAIGNINLSFFSHLNNVECNWSIYPITIPDSELALHKAIFSKFDSNHNESFATIRYYKHSPPALGITIYFPEPHFKTILRYFHKIFEFNKLCYMIDFEFPGFPNDPRIEYSPTIEEFKNGAIILSENPSLSIRKDDNT